MTRLRNVRLSAKFVFRDVPGVWKRVSNDKARCIFGDRGSYDQEIGIDPDADVFVLDDVAREVKSQNGTPTGSDAVRVTFEDDEGGVFHERVVSWGEAVVLSRADFVMARLAPHHGKEILHIGDVGFDVEDGLLCLEVMDRSTVTSKRDSGGSQ
jgi:hypothetical protein